MSIQKITDLNSIKEYFERIGAEPRGLFSAVVKETIGSYWQEVAYIKFIHKQGNLEVKATVGYEPTEEEFSLIKAEFLNVKWPKNIYPTSLENLPQHLKEANKEDLFIFWDKPHKHILMLQHRIETDKGKAYIPWSCFDDGIWRACEPETENGLLPLYGLHTLKDQTVAFCFEGAKTARFAERILNPKTPEERQIADDFPWNEQFRYAASVGFVGGALVPERTDWSQLKKSGIQRVIIFADNDEAGMSVVPKIADLVNLPCFVVKFSDQWPRGWDIADEWPESMWRTIDGRKYYIGPSYFDCLSPATFMTRLTQVTDEKGKIKMVPKLRHHAISQWAYVEGQDMFVNTEFPHFAWKPETLDKILAPFSHSKHTSELLFREYSARMSKFAYRPDMNKRKVIVDGELCLNLFRPGFIAARPGNPKPFLDFMEFLVPDPKERKNVLRWCATLIAKPEIRMLYGLLLISEQTGVGKTMLAESILAPLVGMHNCSFPSEEIIMGQFTSWIAKKRLVIIGEVYSGHSFKMANRLKQYLTDNKISYRELYESPVTIDNFAHFLACSNSINALRLDERDRRWFVPKITESRLKDEEYDSFVAWLHSGGLSIIRHWAENFDDYVTRSEKSPNSIRKDEMIEDSKSKAVVRCEELAKLMNDYELPVAVGDKLVKQWAEVITREKVYEKERELCQVMRKCGLFEYKEEQDGSMKNFRLSIESQFCNVLLSRKAVEKLNLIPSMEERKKFVKSIIKRPSELLVWE